MAKARDAFRTISEVSSALETPTHVLRFWESKFSQIKPVKRAGGRRYYRPDDIRLLSGIKTLLHEQGMTIKGAQKMLRELGVKHVMGLASVDPTATSTPAPGKRSKRVEVTAPVDSQPEPAASPAPVTTMPPPTTTDTNVVAMTPMESSERTPVEPQATHEAAPVATRTSILSLFGGLDRDAIRSRSAQIAPLIARLETTRDRMHGN